MCQIFGAFLERPAELNQYLKSFYANSDRHPNGWGLALMDTGGFSLEKEPVQATKSVYLKNRLSVSIRSAAAFAHIRYATVGNVKYENAHPFTETDNAGRRWVQNHNGTIFDYPKLDRYLNVQQGDTDSERVLLYVVDRINRAEGENGPLDSDARFRLLDNIICDLSKGNKLNYMLYDGEQLYVHTNYENSLYVLQKDSGVLFATEPLSGEEWKPLPMNTLLGFRNGKHVFTGTNHGNTYIEDEEAMKMLYLAFSEL